MNIVITAADSKKELLARFCLAYKGVLAKHSIFCTSRTGRYIEEATGLDVVCFLSGPQGGYQQLASKIACNEVDLVIYLFDPLSNEKDNESSKYELNRLCDIYAIPLATNFSTAEALVLGLDRGDLNWRIFVNPLFRKKTS